MKPLNKSEIHSKNSTEILYVFFTARTCYKHLAGELGVSIFSALKKLKYIESNDNGVFSLTEKGEIWSQKFSPPFTYRKTIGTCIDCTHKTEHLSGSWAVDLCSYLLKHEYIKHGLLPRSIIVTHKGRDFFYHELLIECKDDYISNKLSKT